MCGRGRTGVLAALLALALSLAACGGDEGGGGAQGGDAGAIEGAKVAPTLEQAKRANGSVTFCAGKDTTGGYMDAVERFNRRYADQGLKANMVEFPTGSDAQREQSIQRLQAKSPECDVYQADVIWTAEFASQKWLMDLTKYVEGRAREFIPSTLDGVRYDDRYWSVPQVTGAGLIYRRTDQAREAPATWQALYDAAAEGEGYAYQGAAYEGLTVDFLEVAFAAGGGALSEDGSEARFDTPQNRKALDLMVGGMRNGATVKAVPTYMEEEARGAFEAGRATFMRNWSYAYSLALKSDEVKDDFAVSALPAFEGGGRAGVLGGNGPVLSAFAQNAEGGLLFIDHLTSQATLARNMAEHSLPSTLQATYDRPEVKQAIPYAAQLKQAIEQARPRPVSPVYPQISQAISDNVNKALSGELSPDKALSQGQAEIARALKSF